MIKLFYFIRVKCFLVQFRPCTLQRRVIKYYFNQVATLRKSLGVPKVTAICITKLSAITEKKHYNLFFAVKFLVKSHCDTTVLSYSVCYCQH